MGSYALDFVSNPVRLPARVRASTEALQYFVVATTARTTHEARQRWQEDWECACRTGTSPHVAQRNFLPVFTKHALPPEWVDAFLEALIQDTLQTSYATYQELERHLQGSATVIGYLVARLWGASDESLPYIRALAEGARLTQILCSVSAEWQARGKIYLPEEALARFDLTLDSVREGGTAAAWPHFLHFEAERTRALLRFGWQGVSSLPRDCRGSVARAIGAQEQRLGKLCSPLWPR